MARSVNKVILIGNLGQDPELRYTPSGTAVCNMRLATNESYKDNSGEWVEKTEWHTIVAWARLAEICGEYLKKGSRVYFEGSLQTRSWDDKDGNTRYSTEIKVRDMMMLDDRGSSGGGGGGFGGEQSSYNQGGGRSSGGNQGGNQGGYGNQGGGRPQRQPQTASANDDFSFEPDDELPF